MSQERITVKGIDIQFKKINQNEYISLTDIAKYKNPEFPAEVVRNWLRNRMTIEFLGIWEQLYNPNFKLVEFNQFRQQAGLNSFVLSPQKWIEETNAIGITSTSGRYGGTYAHNDIALEFANWVSVEFRLYIIKEFQRLKEEEQKTLEWTAKRELSKINYRIHTDAIKDNLIVQELSSAQISFVYASEADVLNMALFGKTAKDWHNANSELKGNIRDYATVEQLLVLANLESYNAILIEEKRSQRDRLMLLNKTARRQLETLYGLNRNSDIILGFGESKEKKE